MLQEMMQMDLENDIESDLERGDDFGVPLFGLWKEGFIYRI